jgi:hypothetical protein
VSVCVTEGVTEGVDEFVTAGVTDEGVSTGSV